MRRWNNVVWWKKIRSWSRRECCKAEECMEDQDELYGGGRYLARRELRFAVERDTLYGGAHV